MAEVVLLVDDLKLLSGIPRCRICHEEEFESIETLEAPCACSGTVKQYEPGYSAPPKKSKINDEAMSIREEEEESNERTEITVEGVAVESDYSECSSGGDRSASCCRSLAIASGLRLTSAIANCIASCVELGNAWPPQELKSTFSLSCGCVVLLSNGTQDYPFTLLTVIILKASGIIIPMYIVIKIVGAIQNSSEQYQDSDDEDEIRHNVNS
ncbi:uncharacterized protein HKW66_Vig0057880 [Vigna angularis]|uniref:RING-CH-type domain-containing protein n=1 Tax=Phaseolus angularis TaxID=3914 RepID=A0A8T0L4R6_PHAAN|nr:uncharacterized protein HKW66_Vig0057880 [Vigna angularis]